MALHRRVRPRHKTRVRKHFSYTVYEVADELAVCRNTVRRWIASGLKTVDGGRPCLITGADLNAFLEGRRKSAKRPCGPSRMFCLRCGEPRRPALGMADYVWNGRAAGNLQALCETCGTLMNRRCAYARIAETMPNLEVTVRQA